MKKFLIWLVAVLVCAGLMVAAVVLLQPEDRKDQKEETQQESQQQTQSATEEMTQVNLAPDFTVVDAEGNEVQLSQLRGKPVVLNFWASWCPPCKAEMPDFEIMYQKYGKDVQFMMVDLTDGQSETLEKAKQHIADNGYTFPVYFDTMLDAANTYGIQSIPQSFFISAEGTLVTYAMGMISGEQLETCIQMLLR